MPVEDGQKSPHPQAHGARRRGVPDVVQLSRLRATRYELETTNHYLKILRIERIKLTVWSL